MMTQPPPNLPQFALVSDDPQLVAAMQGVLGVNGRIALKVVEGGLDGVEERLQLDAVEVIIVDVEATRRDQLLALQRLMGTIDGHPPVVVVTDVFDEALARWFLQIRVTDFVKKPVDPIELFRTCIKAMGAMGGDEIPVPTKTKDARILSFVPAAGGVGVTTLAIQAALTLAKSGSRRDRSQTCLVDLDFQHSSCADYLDLEPLLDLNEIGAHPDRVDHQLLEVMFSHHASGLSVLAAPNRPAQMLNLDPMLVARLLDLVAARFDNVIIDMPRAWSPWNDDVIAGSDKVYVVTDMTVPGLRLARRMGLAIRERLEEPSRCEVIVNRFEQSMFGTGLRKADIDNALGGMFAGTVANNYRLVREAIDRGVPIDEVKSASNVAGDLRRILLPGQGEKAAPIAAAAPAKVV
jgi:pilus assembly protein CpaE